MKREERDKMRENALRILATRRPKEEWVVKAADDVLRLTTFLAVSESQEPSHAEQQ